MFIELKADMTVQDVKRAFHEAYPYLKLEFFMQKHASGEGTSLSQKVDDATQLVDVRGAMKEGTVDVEPQQTVMEMEQLFQEKFNLPVQVFRKSKSIWLETTETDRFTLQQQNELGKESTLGLTGMATGYYDE